MRTSESRIAIQNQHGRFIHCLQLGRYDAIPELFSHSGAQYAFYDENVHCGSMEEIKEYFSKLGQAENKSIVIAHTPVIRVENDDVQAKATWMATEFHLLKQVDGIYSECRILRFDADFVLEDGDWRYKKLEQYYFMALLPEPCPEQPAYPGTLPVRSDLEKHGRISPRDYIEVARIQSRWAHNRRRAYDRNFAHTDEAVLSLPSLLPSTCQGFAAIRQGLAYLDTKEAENAGKYLSVTMTASPVIEMDGQGGVNACWLSITHDLKDKAFGRAEGGCTVLPVIGRFDQHLIKENGEWRYDRFSFTPLLTLKERPFDYALSEKCVISFPGSNWLDAPAPTGVLDDDSADDILELEDYVGWWTAGLRYRCESPFYYRYLARERPDILEWSMLARNPGDPLIRTATTMEGIHKEIFGMTDLFHTYQPKGPGFHCGMTPVIELSEDRTRATAVWLDYGWTLRAEAFNLTEPPFPALPAVARYEHKYIKINGQWKLYSFKWFPLFRMKPWEFSYENTRGWTASASKKRFPLPFEPYEYMEERRNWKEPFLLEPSIITSPYEKQVGLIRGD